MSRSRTLTLVCVVLFCFALSQQLDWHFTFFRNTSSLQVEESCLAGRTLPKRVHTASLADFGGVGDGVYLNTGAFEKAISELQIVAEQGGAQLNVPAGNWLTGCFNLTSHFTLYLEQDAVILGSQDPQDWPLINPLPSYGRGRERLGERYISLIHGENLVDVVVTGQNGTIDGQGSIWWKMWWNHTLKYTRGHLVEFIGSQDIIISNVVLRNSPFWTVHPVYCNNVIVKDVTILAPYNSPNTDGIDPDSSSNVCIEDCYISNGDDLIAIKSGWDEYGMRVARPSSNITVRRVTGTTPTCSGIAFGSEMSGGITNVSIKDVHVFNTSAGIRLKTAPGRGSYITNITISGMTLRNVKWAIEFSGDAGEHPDDNYNRTAFSVMKGIVVKDMVGEQIKFPGRFVGVREAPFLNVCLSSISLELVVSGRNTWACSYVEGSSWSVSPMSCRELQTSNGRSSCIDC